MYGHTAESHFADKPVAIRMVGRVDDPGGPVLRLEYQCVVAQTENRGAKAGHLRGWANCADFLPGDMDVAGRKQANRVNAELIGDDLARPEVQFEGYEKADGYGAEDLEPDGLGLEDDNGGAKQVHHKSDDGQHFDAKVAGKTKSFRIHPVAEGCHNPILPK